MRKDIRHITLFEQKDPSSDIGYGDGAEEREQRQAPVPPLPTFSTRHPKACY